LRQVYHSRVHSSRRLPSLRVIIRTCPWTEGLYRRRNILPLRLYVIIRRHMPQSRCTPDDRRDRHTSSRLPHAQSHSKMSGEISRRIVSRRNLPSLKDTHEPPQVFGQVLPPKTATPDPASCGTGR